MIRQDVSAQTFLDHVEPLLVQDEAANNLMLGLCLDLAASPREVLPSPLFLRVMAGEQTVAAALQMPPYNLILMAAEDDALTLLAQYLRKAGSTIPGIIGPPREADAFAKIWAKHGGAKIRQIIDQRIYRLDQVIPPQPVPGSMVKAELSDAQLLAQWLYDFTVEVLPAELRTPDEYLAQVLAKIDKGLAYVWKVDGSAVTMAFATRPTRHGIAIGPVFTPEAQRRKGFAAALVGALSQAMLDSGRQFCVLYTDLSNPTSNKIYINLGYRPIAESRYLVFT